MTRLFIFSLLFWPAAEVLAGGYCAIGAVVSSNPRQSFAVFSPDDRLDDDFEYGPSGLVFKRIGDSLMERRICGIEARMICMEQLGIESLMMFGLCISDADQLQPPPKEIEVVDNTVEISLAYKEHLSSGLGLAKTLMQAASLPSFDAFGDQVGFSIWDIEVGSIYEDVGLMNGDVITAINGMQMTSAGTAINILFNVRDQTEWRIDLLREGSPLAINIRVR
jgi:hypothetical protein